MLSSSHFLRDETAEFLDSLPGKDTTDHFACRTEVIKCTGISSVHLGWFRAFCHRNETSKHAPCAVQSDKLDDKFPRCSQENVDENFDKQI